MLYPQLDWQTARADTPAVDNLIHFNNAGASLMPTPVTDAVLAHLMLETAIGGYEAADLQQESIEQVYDSVAALINCKRGEVALIENATRAWDMAFYSLQFKPGDRILTSVAEYASNYLAFLQVSRATGATIEVIPNDAHGQTSVTALANLLDARVKLIAITHVPTNGGLVNPAAEIGKLARQAGVLYLLDACQSVGQMPVDVQAIGCDMLSATGRKFLRAPRGTGFLYVRNELLQTLHPPFIDLHAAQWTGEQTYELQPDARRFETWERNYSGLLGLGAAIDYARQWGLESIWQRVSWLAEELRNQLREIPGCTVHDTGEEKCGIVTFTIAGTLPDDLKLALRKKRINTSVAVLEHTRLDMTARNLKRLSRASVHYYNTEEEIGQFCEILAELG